MGYRIIFIVWVVTACCTGFTLAVKHNPEQKSMLRWVVLKNSSITVKGESNVNKFECIVTQYIQPDTLCYQKENAQLKPFFKGLMTVDVVMFDCHNKYMTGDMRKTLKANEFPKLRIKFLSLEQPIIPDLRDQHIPGLVEVELAGIKKQFRINFRFQFHDPAFTIMHGERVFLFTDFGLTPPQKMAGMIKVKNEFNVVFHLELKQV